MDNPARGRWESAGHCLGDQAVRSVQGKPRSGNLWRSLPKAASLPLGAISQKLTIGLPSTTLASEPCPTSVTYWGALPTPRLVSR